MRSSRRPAFTLVEMLVALTLMLILAGLIVGLGPRFIRSNRTAGGAGQLQSWIRIAQNRARKDGVATGLQLMGDATNPLVTTLQYIQRPDNYTPVGPSGIRAVQIANGPTFDQVDFASPGNQDFSGGYTNAIQQSVQPGDVIIFTKTNQGAHRIVSVDPAGQFIKIFAPGAPKAAIPATTDWYISREPRPIQGEQPLVLPDTVVIDTTTNATYGAPLPPDYKIVFGGNGNIMSPRIGKIILWVRSTDPGVAEMNLVTIYSYTGLVATHQVNTTPNPAGSPPYLDPYSFTRDGR